MSSVSSYDSQCANEDGLSIMGLNTWLIPVANSFPKYIDTTITIRAETVSNFILEAIDTHDLGIVTLQEVWSPDLSIFATLINVAFSRKLFGRQKIISRLTEKSDLKYLTGIHGTHKGHLKNALKFFDSGLLIASKWPIIKEEFQQFDKGTGADSYASKGILIAAIERPQDILLVATTHLDAGTDFELKKEQITASLLFINAFQDSIELMFSGSDNNKIVRTPIITGDFNINSAFRNENDRESNGKSYEELNKLMNDAQFYDGWNLTDEKPTPGVKFLENSVVIDEHMDISTSQNIQTTREELPLKGKKKMGWGKSLKKKLSSNCKAIVGNDGRQSEKEIDIQNLEKEKEDKFNYSESHCSNTASSVHVESSVHIPHHVTDDYCILEGCTNDQSIPPHPQRLDYIWVSPNDWNVDDFRVSDPVYWRAPVEMRLEMVTLAASIVSQKDGIDHGIDEIKKTDDDDRIPNTPCPSHCKNRMKELKSLIAHKSKHSRISDHAAICAYLSPK